MGKKRRLNSAKAKFSAKHKNHPRVRLLAKRAEEAAPLETAEEIKLIETPVEVEKSTADVVLKAKEPKSPVKDDPIVQKAKKTTTTKKNKVVRSRKRVTKKKTTSATA